MGARKKELIDLKKRGLRKGGKPPKPASLDLYKRYGFRDRDNAAILDRINTYKTKAEN